MDRSFSPKAQAAHMERQLAHLKILSRLLGHELHAQQGPKITLSREEFSEIQTSIDLFIEEFLRNRGPAGTVTDVEIRPAPARVN